jgi:Holliday junction resolvasome RuvABC ATP-dependent DNA helicase subunit
MHIEKIDIKQQSGQKKQVRPDSFDSFIGQTHITTILKTAIDSAHKK